MFLHGFVIVETGHEGILTNTIAIFFIWIQHFRIIKLLETMVGDI